MRTVTNPARPLLNRPISNLGPVLHLWLAGGLVLLCLVGAVLPTMQALRSPLTGFATPLNRHTNTSSESELAELVRLTRERRTLVAQQSHRAAQSSEALARLHADRQGALDRLLNMTGAAAMSTSDWQSLNADWARLEEATDNPQIAPQALFVQHSRLIDKQLALLSALADRSS